MICEKCKKEGRKSKIVSMGGTSTLMSYSAFFDEEGNRHIHNPNKNRYGYYCSNNHKFSIVEYDKCSSCNYGTEAREIIYHE